MKIKLLGLKAAFILSAVTFISCGESQTNSADSSAVEEVEEVVEATTSNANLDVSTVMWKGTMMGMYSHEGTINMTEATVDISGENIVGGSFTVDMTSMSPTDQNYDPAKESTPEKLVGHLQSPDFFDVATYPTSNFVITGSAGNTVTGNLTLRGVTNEEVIENVTFNAESHSWTGTMKVDRKKYDVAFDMPMKEMVLSDEIELAFSLSL